MTYALLLDAFLISLAGGLLGWVLLSMFEE